MRIRLFIILLFCLPVIYGQILYQVAFKHIPYVIDSTSELTTTGAGTPLNEWTGGAYIYSVNGVYATVNTNGLREDVSVASLPDLTGKTIVGIKFQIMGSCNATGTDVIGVELSWDGGTSWTSTGYTKTYTTITDTYKTFGGPTDLWGHSWTYAELLTLKIRQTLISHDQMFYEDHIGKFIIYYHS